MGEGHFLRYRIPTEHLGYADLGPRLLRGREAVKAVRVGSFTVLTACMLILLALSDGVTAAVVYAVGAVAGLVGVVISLRT